MRDRLLSELKVAHQAVAKDSRSLMSPAVAARRDSI